MSNLHPGGQRTAPHARIFGYENIRRVIRTMKLDPARDAHTSIAGGNRHGGAHQHKREIARRQRQAARRAA
jgi:hypothetical protein